LILKIEKKMRFEILILKIKKAKMRFEILILKIEKKLYLKFLF